MCGIIGILSNQPVVNDLIKALKCLEYRGYDSAGFAAIENQQLIRLRASGKIINLEKKIANHNFATNLAIGHTRWATHGAPTEENAHPHMTKKVAVVHNGIIENYSELIDFLKGKGYVFESQTDSEVIPKLIDYQLTQGHSVELAVSQAIKCLEGKFAIAVLFAGDHQLMIGARRGSPLIIGYNNNATYLCSDAKALNSLTDKISYLMDDDIVVIKQQQVNIYNNNQLIERQQELVKLDQSINNKGKFAHYMLKEIYEQPQTINKFVEFYLTHQQLKLKDDFIQRITIIGCGTAYYAAMIAKYWFEELANINVEVDIASEFIYRKQPYNSDLYLFISQSGETADTLSAIKHIKKQNCYSLAIVNNKDSSIAREADSVLDILAGSEIGVASTKAFTHQLTTLFWLVLKLANKQLTIADSKLNYYYEWLAKLPSLIDQLLNYNEIEKLALKLSIKQNILYIGRGTSYVIALEGALKLRELAYIPTQAVAAGELKHGTLALVDEDLITIAIMPTDDLIIKNDSSVQEILARGGKVVIISDKLTTNQYLNDQVEQIMMPKIIDELTPILYSIPVQLLAYYIAKFRGHDIDQPRNLAKSVTVE